MKTSEQINEIAAAMAKAQSMLKPAHKDSTNPAYRSKYADLASVWAAWQEAGPQCGLAVWQDVTTVEGGIAVATLVTHSSGQFMEFGPLIVPLGKHDAHGVGSATTYGKRFGLAASVGLVADDDDDGNGAVATQPAKPIPAYYRGKPPASGAPAEVIGQPDRPAGPPTTAAEAQEAFPTDNEDRPFMLDACKRKVEGYKLSGKEREALKKVWLGGHAADLAKTADLHRLYLFLGDAEAVAQWRAEFAKGAA